jgi:hypothetical protein
MILSLFVAETIPAMAPAKRPHRRAGSPVA